jgi:hypothetical protein
VSVAGKIKFAERATVKSVETPQVVDTGGGAYIGGSVATGGGDFVGRDQIELVGQPAPSLEQLRSLVAEIGRALSQTQLPPEIAEVVGADFTVLEQQAARETPNPAILRSKLDGLMGLLPSGGETSEQVGAIRSLADRARQMARVPFR